MNKTAVKPLGQLRSILWNLTLLTIGSACFAVGANAIAMPHGFLVGGLFGTGILVWLATGLLNPSIWFFLFNLPMFALAWFHVGRPFFFYSLYGTVVTSLVGSFVHFQIPIEGDIQAAVAAGVLCGLGGGIALRSMGSGGGLDLLGVVLNRKFNIGVGRFSFTYNAILFLTSLKVVSTDLFIASIIQVFIATNALEYVLRLFSQRKTVFIVSERGEEISEAIIAEGYSGCTILRGKGGYSGESREILLTVTNNLFLRRLEKLEFGIDKQALFIVENTFYVSGASIPRKLF